MFFRPYSIFQGSFPGGRRERTQTGLSGQSSRANRELLAHCSDFQTAPLPEAPTAFSPESKEFLLGLLAQQCGGSLRRAGKGGTLCFRCLVWARREARMLETDFGDAYREYRRRWDFDPTLALQLTSSKLWDQHSAVGSLWQLLCWETFLALRNAALPAFSVDRSSETARFDARTVSASLALARPTICRFSPVSAII